MVKIWQKKGGTRHIIIISKSWKFIYRKAKQIYLCTCKEKHGHSFWPKEHCCQPGPTITWPTSAQSCTSSWNELWALKPFLFRNHSPQETSQLLSVLVWTPFSDTSHLEKMIHTTVFHTCFVATKPNRSGYTNVNIKNKQTQPKVITLTGISEPPVLLNQSQLPWDSKWSTPKHCTAMLRHPRWALWTSGRTGMLVLFPVGTQALHKRNWIITGLIL